MQEVFFTLTPIVGALLVALVLLDVFLTVLVVSAQAGVLAPLFSGGVWRGFVLLSRAKGSHRRWWKSWAGPVILLGIVLLWSVLLILGFALIFWPAIPPHVAYSGGGTDGDFWTALYFSGMCFTTVGVGDFYATHDFYRILAIVEAGLGFGMLTLSLTYLSGIYQAIQTRNSLALNVHAFSLDTGDAKYLAEVLMRPSEGLNLADQLRSQFNTFLAAHHQYPIIHYFRFEEPFYSSVRFMLVAQDALSLVDSLPQSEEAAEKTSQAHYEALRRVLARVRAEFTALLGERDGEHGPSPERVGLWEQRHRDACQHLRETGIPLREEVGEAREDYVAARREWEPTLRQLAEYFNEPWELVDVATSRQASPDAPA